MCVVCCCLTQVCLRFVAICRLLHDQEDRDSTVGWSAHVTSGPGARAQPPPLARSLASPAAAPEAPEGAWDRRSVVPVIIPPEEVRRCVASTEGAAAPRTASFSPHPLSRPHATTQLWTHQVQGLRKEFFTQISYLFQIMRKVENRGFMFRLDFNGYLSTLANEISSGM